MLYYEHFLIFFGRFRRIGRVLKMAIAWVNAFILKHFRLNSADFALFSKVNIASKVSRLWHLLRESYCIGICKYIFLLFGRNVCFYYVCKKMSVWCILTLLPLYCFESHKSEANDFKWLNNFFMAIIHKIKLEWYQYLKYKIHNERSKSLGVLRV